MGSVTARPDIAERCGPTVASVVTRQLVPALSRTPDEGLGILVTFHGGGQWAVLCQNEEEGVAAVLEYIEGHG